MPARRQDHSRRVVIIASVLAVVLIVALVFLNRLGRPAGDLPPTITDDPTDATTDPLITEEIERAPLTLRLMILDSSTRRLIPRRHEIEAQPTLSANAQAALQALITAIDSPLPPGTVVHEVWISPGGVAFVDFRADFPSQVAKGSLGEMHAIYGVVGTLTSSFPEIVAVQFLVAGQPIDTLTGHLDTSGPITPNAEWIY